MAIFHRQPLGHEYDFSRVTITWLVAEHVTTHDVLADENFPVVYNDTDPDSPTSGRRCSAIRINATGFKVFSIEATYSIPDFGMDAHDKPEPSEETPVIFQWQTVHESVSVDRDLNGNAIVTSAGRSTEEYLMRTLSAKRLTVTKWLGGFDVSRALEYENSVNNAAFGGAAANEVMCETIEPSSAYVPTAILVPIAHTFLFKPVSIWKDHPHQPVLKDQDSYGAVGSNVLRFVTKKGDPMDDVPMDGKGRPLNSSVTYKDPTTGVIASSPTWDDRGTPTGATVVVSGAIVFLRYMLLPQKNFGALQL